MKSKDIALSWLLLASGGAWAQDVVSPDLERNAWFRPLLEENSDEVCSEVLRVVRKQFFSANSLSQLVDVYGSKDIGTLERITQEEMESETFEDPSASPGDSASRSVTNQIVTVDGKRVYLRFGATPGCGGACEGALIAATGEPQKEYGTSRFQVGDDRSKPITSGGAIFRSGKGKYYSVYLASDVIQIERLTSNPNWANACRVRVQPAAAQTNSDPASQKLRGSLQQLIESLRWVQRGEGNCGSMRALSRRINAMRESLDEVAYRPWAERSGNDGFMQSLELWSLTGSGQYEAFQRFRSMLATTEATLAEFFRDKFKWSRQEAASRAHTALTNALSAGFAFGRYDPFNDENEVALRRAVLGGEPIAAIRSLQLPGSKDKSRFDFGAFADDLLGTAVRRPDVVRELLERGANPNEANAFGKTALMHAAQQNQIESVRVLLAGGADPNAKTLIPSDSCFYSLSTSALTALHYAARYSSPEVIRFLVDKGAATYAAARQSYGAAGRFPVDWLAHYTRADSPERNPNIPASAIDDLKTLLRVPDDDELYAIANRLTLRGEQEYRSNNVDAAYASLSAAIQTGKASLRTLSDMSLVAAKAGQQGEALAATQTLIDNKTDDAMAATGWFNRGLVCESSEQSNQPRPFYDGRYYCRESLMYSFLRAWELGKQNGARSKVSGIFNASAPNTCAKATMSGIVRRYHSAVAEGAETANRGSRHRIFVQHAPKDSVDPSGMTWKLNTYPIGNGRPVEVTVVPKVINTLDLGEFAVTVLDSDYFLPSSGNGRVSICELIQ